jgi:hypothetical protein
MKKLLKIGVLGCTLVFSNCAGTGLVADTSKTLLDSCIWAAPIATEVISAFGGPKEQAAMFTANASLNVLAGLSKNLQTQDEKEFMETALKTTWKGIDSAFQNDPNAERKLLAIVHITEAAKNLLGK